MLDRVMGDSSSSGSFPRTNRRRFIAAGAALGLAGIARTGASQPGAADAVQTASQRIDLVLTNGQFVDHRGIVGDTLALANGRIAAAGTNVDAPAMTPVVDLGGRTVIPGFVDGHVHYTRAGVNPGYQERRIERAFSIRALQETLARRAGSVPRGEFITCIGGWNHQQLAERRAPTRAELDEAAPDHAVYLSGTGGGTGAIANSRAARFFEARGITV